MEKEAFYFPHFCNARHDRKIRRLRRELGVEGYGIYFMLLETLREQQDLVYPLEDLDLLADEFGVSEAKIRVTVCNYELFEIDNDEKFFSPKMLVYLEPYFRMKEQRKLAGKASADKRLSNDRSTTVQQKKGKESKEKESKVNKIVIEQVAVPTERDLLFQRWFDYKKSKKSTYTEIGKAQLIKDWSDKSDNELKEAIDHSIGNNYQGLFAPKKNIGVDTTKKIGKFEQNIINLQQAKAAIDKSHDDGTYNNPFDFL
jgi:hypothetical protein